MFFLDLRSCCRSTCQFRWDSEKSNHMLSATSNIELEFFRNFLNMFKSKIPISTNFAVSEGAVTHSPDFMHNVPVMGGRWCWKHLHIIFAIDWEFKLVILHRSCGTIIFCCLGQYWDLVSCNLSSLHHPLTAVTGASLGAIKRALKNAPSNNSKSLFYISIWEHHWVGKSFLHYVWIGSW